MPAAKVPALKLTQICMALEQKDIEIVESIIFKHSDDVAVSIARSFERLEERIDGAESRVYTRISDIDDRIEACREDISDSIGDVKDAVRELVHEKLETEYA